MKNVSPVSIGTLVLAFLVFGLFPSGRAYCREGGIALLLQQTPSQGGTVSPDVGVHRYDAHEKVTLVAVPKPGYNFIYWLGDVLDPTASKTTALLDEPKVIVAVFQRVDDDQLVVGQTATRLPAVGGGASSFSSSSPSVSGGGGGGSSPPGDNPDQPTEGDPPPDGPPDLPGDPGDTPDNPFDPPDDPFDPPDDPYDPPFDPPDDPFNPPDPPEVPEPATGLLLTLGGLALLRKRKSAAAERRKSQA